MITKIHLYLIFCVLCIAVGFGFLWQHKNPPVLSPIPVTSPIRLKANEIRGLTDKPVELLRQIAGKEGTTFSDLLQSGNGKQLFDMAAAYASGNGVTADASRARRSMERAAELGYPAAMRGLGRYNETGFGGPMDGKAAEKWYQQAAKQGEVDAYADIARMYIAGEAVAPDPTKANFYIEKGLESGSIKAKYLKAATLVDNPATQSEALRYLGEAAKEGDADAQQLLGRLYNEGKGITKDPQKALEWARAAAENGSVTAKRDIANYLLKESGASPTPEAAREIVANLASALEQQSPQAAYQLALLTMGSQDATSVDRKNARSLAEQAFDGGLNNAAFLRAALAGDSVDATTWLEKGAAVHDWKSVYARKLISSGETTVTEAISAAQQMTYSEYLGNYAQTNKSSSGTLPPRAVAMEMPRFPTGLDSIAVKGTVTAEFVVSSNGIPTAVQILDATHPELAASAATAIAKWRFKPAMRNGVAVPQRVRSPINFVSTK